MSTKFAPKVSVITPTYNQAQFIGECISSVIAQTYPNWEQVIVDDESTDNTAEVVERWTDPRVRYERQPHAGILALSETYNRALRSSDGELVAILEGDDFWAPEKLEVLVPRFVDPDVVLAYGRAAIVAGGRPTGKSIPDEAFERTYGSRALFNRPRGAAAYALLQADVVPFTFPCSVVIRRTALEAIGGFQKASDLGAVDYPTFLMLSLRGGFEYADRVVAYWRRHRGSGSWPGHQRDMRAAAAFARSFVARQAEELRFRPHEIALIERTWRRRLQRAAFNTGRYLLLQGKWPEARDQFLQALLSPYLPVFLGGLVGYLASVLRTDIEGLMAAAGRVAFPTEHTAGR